MSQVTPTKATAAQQIPASPIVDEHHCLVCYHELDYPAILPCNHNHVCGECHLRLRYLHNDRKCPMCKQENQTIIVDLDPNREKEFGMYSIWGNELGADFTFREDVGMFFYKKHYEKNIAPLFGYHCTEPNCDYDGTTPDEDIYNQQQQQSDGGKRKNQRRKPPSPLRALQDHLRNKHRLALCQYCVDHKRDFIANLPRWSPTQLKRHHQRGDGPNSGFQGHPVCEFCRPQRFYSLVELHLHLQKEHYKCHVCEKQGLDNQYFKNYASLETHFDRQHFLCHDAQCLAARFVVFENELDLRGHELSTHGSTKTGSTKINLEFRVRREGYDGSYENQQVPSADDFQYGLDGEAFVPGDLPRQQDEPSAETSHPLHFQRTAEIRAQAAQIREQQNLQSTSELVDSFPVLTDSTAPAVSDALRMGWTSDTNLSRIKRTPGVQTNSQDQFPSLPTASGKKKSVTAQVRGNSRQFTAMQAAANAPSTSAASWNAVTSNTASAPRPTSAATSFISSSTPGLAINRASNLSADNFPSLGGGGSTSTSRYQAAEALAHKSRHQKKEPPSLGSTSDFPPPQAMSASTLARNKVLGERKPAAAQAPAMTTLNFPPPPSSTDGQATVAQMKAVLGPRYKELKSLTKEFASDSLTPEAYVDHAASLFDGGYSDADFWTFVPSLLMSCPDQTTSNQAIRYMDELRTSAMNAQVNAAASANNAGWSGAPATVAAAPKRAPNTASPGRSNSSWTASTARPYSTPTPVAFRNVAPFASAKPKASTWGSGNAAAMAKSKPGTVSLAASRQGPQQGSATKFMAKEQKKAKQPQQQQGQKKNKKKERDELRALAFGR